MSVVVANAKRFIGAGLSVIPVKQGTKTPGAEWKRYQSDIMDEADADRMFAGCDIGVVCGKVSGNVECLDFDDPAAYDEWLDLVENHGGGEALDTVYVQRTPSGGMHVVYRLPYEVGGNKKLAVDEKGQVRIETRGEGGYFKVAPSPGYESMNKAILRLPCITADQHELFLASARFLSHKATETVTGPIGPTRDGTSPGHKFNEQGSWFDILEPLGWQHAGKAGERDLWVRPGKKRGDGISATTNHKNSDLLWVFSSNATPFEADKSYTKFGAYAYLFFGGDFGQAAQDLAGKGYREAKPQEREVPPPQPVAPRMAGGMALQVYGEKFESVTPEYLIRPYLRRGKAVLFDADGGTGKTSFALALAAWVSRGITMSFGEMDSGRPVKTLYLHKGEDSSEELETVYRANGGVPGMIAYAGEDWALTSQGCRILEETIRAHGFELIVLDALFYFLHDLPQSHLFMKDGLAVTKALSPLMDVYARTGATGLHIRHTSKGAAGKPATELGMGSQAFRNRHRGQFIMRYHPDRKAHPGVVGICDGKGSLLTMMGESFFFRRVGLEVQPVLNISGDPWSGSTGQSEGSTKQAEINEWLAEYVGHGGIKYLRDIMSAATDAGYHKGQLYRAQQMLGLKQVEVGDRKCWACKTYGIDLIENDPYA